MVRQQVLIMAAAAASRQVISRSITNSSHSSSINIMGTQLQGLLGFIVGTLVPAWSSSLRAYTGYTGLACHTRHTQQAQRLQQAGSRSTQRMGHTGTCRPSVGIPPRGLQALRSVLLRRLDPFHALYMDY